jgi:threonine synthase
MNNYLNRFVCIRCGQGYLPEQILYTCEDCGGNLDARYDYEAIGEIVTPAGLGANKDLSLWRYRPFLPLNLSGSPISLQIGMTPLTPAPNLGQQLGLQHLYLKNDCLNPSGSFKDRASFVILAHCIAKNISTISAASTGNAGTSMACLAASAQMETFIFVPHTAPEPKIAQLLIYGAGVFLVRGDYGQAFELCEQVSTRLGWFNRNTGTNPYTREGKKTVSFEIWEQLGFNVPDVVVVSVGDGNIISGVYKGFYDLYQTGLIKKMPRLVGVQSTGSAAIADAYQGDGVIRSVKPDTIADSISGSMPSDGEAALWAVKETQGTMVAVDDDRILQSIKALGQTEGVFAEPSGAAGVAGIEDLVDGGTIRPDETVVLIVTGSGLKDVTSALKVAGQAVTIEPDVDAALKVLTQI